MAILVSVTDVGERGRTTGGRSGGTGGLCSKAGIGACLDDWKGSDGSDGGSLLSVMRADKDRHFSFPVRNGIISVFGHSQGTENPEKRSWNQENSYLRAHSLV